MPGKYFSLVLIVHTAGMNRVKSITDDKIIREIYALNSPKKVDGSIPVQLSATECASSLTTICNESNYELYIPR